MRLWVEAAKEEDEDDEPAILRRKGCFARTEDLLTPAWPGFRPSILGAPRQINRDLARM